MTRLRRGIFSTFWTYVYVWEREKKNDASITSLSEFRRHNIPAHLEMGINFYTRRRNEKKRVATLTFASLILSSIFRVWPSYKYYPTMHVDEQKINQFFFKGLYGAAHFFHHLYNFNRLLIHWVTVAQADYQITVTCTIVFRFLSNNLFCYHLRYFEKHHYIVEMFSFSLKKS